LENDIFAKNVYVYETLASTNETAKEKALAGAAHGTTVIAVNQTNGRGSRGRRFFSARGGVFMSVILRPKLSSPETATLITTAAAVIVCRAVRDVAGRDCRIKWVNDVFLGGKKICGILTETVSGNDAVILGVGINVTLGDDFPEELRGSAGAVFQDGEEVESDVKDRLISYLIDAFTAFSDDRFTEEGIMEEYRLRSLVTGREVTVAAPTGEYTAFAVDIDGMGRLIVKKADGTLETLSSGEISIKI
jgi:BirA family biotin operon repressor/biotin-[acetyl-CoA-carboxylase] ligase